MADNNDVADEPQRIPNFPDKATPDVELLYVSNFRGFETKGSPIEVRSRDARTIGGYAAVFNKRSVNLGGFHETLDPRVFNKSRTDGFPGVICRFNHSDDMVLGTTRAGPAPPQPQPPLYTAPIAAPIKGSRGVWCELKLIQSSAARESLAIPSARLSRPSLSLPAESDDDADALLQWSKDVTAE